MATTEEIAELRDLVNDTETPYTFSAQVLSTHIDTEGSVRAAAGVVWTIKATKLAGLVDVTEGSSSRKLGSLYKQALEMAAYFGASPESTPHARRSGTRRIIRA